MKNPNWTRKLLATSLVLAFSALPILQAQAELVNEEVQEDAITPEGGQQKAAARKVVVQEEEQEPDVVIVKKKAPKQKVIYQDPEADSSNTAIISNNENTNTNTTVVQTNPAPRKGIGSSLDEGIDNKISDVRNQFESAVLKSLDRIKITVDDGDSQSSQTTVVQDTVVNTNAAAAIPARDEDYLSLDKAPALPEAKKAEDETVAASSEVVAEKKPVNSSVRIAPVIGFTSMTGSNGYNIDSRYTAGVMVEVDVDSNLTAVLGYSYSQYDVSLASGNNYFNGFNMNLYSNNLNKLEYNQNVFDAGLRFYLLPRESRFRMFVGAGLGFNKGYLNYRQDVLNTFSFNSGYQYSNDLEDYEVTSFLGNLETGADIQLSKNISVGGLVKYSNVLSSRENRPLNNNGFLVNGYGQVYQTDKERAGGSIANNNFYSILGTVKFSF